MTNYRLIYAHQSEHREAFRDISRWGYPYDRDEYLEHITMIRVEPSAGWIWLEWFDDLYDENKHCCIMHLCIRPGHRGLAINRRTIERLYAAVSLMGAHKLYTISNDPQIVGLAKRAGWRQDSIGWYKDV